MAKKATGKSGNESSSGTKKTSSGGSRAVAHKSADSSGSSGGSGSQETMGEMLIKLLQSPLVADLVAVAATAALAALAEHGFTSRNADEGMRQRRAGKAVKEAGKAAASAIGRRLSTELQEIKDAAKESKAREEA